MIINDRNSFTEFVQKADFPKVMLAYAWGTAIALQSSSGQMISRNLYSLADQTLLDQLTIDELLEQTFKFFHEESPMDRHLGFENSDYITIRTMQILLNRTYPITLDGFTGSNKIIFNDCYADAGMLRTSDAETYEWVLQNEKIAYAPACDIQKLLTEVFDRIEKIDFKTTPQDKAIEILVRDITAIWHIQPFVHGNFRTLSLGIIKFLRYCNALDPCDIFMRHSWYLRNALVRAVYTSPNGKIRPTTVPLENFLRNMLYHTSIPLLSNDLLIKNPGEAHYMPNAGNVF